MIIFAFELHSPGIHNNNLLIRLNSIFQCMDFGHFNSCLYVSYGGIATTIISVLISFVFLEKIIYSCRMGLKNDLISACFSVKKFLVKNSWYNDL